MSTIVQHSLHLSQSVKLVRKDSPTSISADQFLNKLFDKYDSNSDNRLTTGQFAQAMRFLTKVLGSTFPKKDDMEDIFMQIDDNGDMSITREQYKKLTICINGVKLYFKGRL